jgi:hypothetical protein
MGIKPSGQIGEKSVMKTGDELPHHHVYQPHLVVYIKPVVLLSHSTQLLLI